MKTSIKEIVSEKLLGKKLKYCSLHRTITQDYLVKKKKSANVTDKQFNSDNPKYFNLLRRQKSIGYHMIFETSLIISIEYIPDYDEETGSSSEFLTLTTANGQTHGLYMDSKIEFIDNDTIMITYK